MADGICPSCRKPLGHAPVVEAAPSDQRVAPSQEKLLPDFPTPKICLGGDAALDAFIKEGRSGFGRIRANIGLLIGGAPIFLLAFLVVYAAWEPLVWVAVASRFTGFIGGAIVGALVVTNLQIVYEHIKGKGKGQGIIYAIAGLALTGATLGGFAPVLGRVIIATAILGWFAAVIDVNRTLTHYQQTAQKRIADALSRDDVDTNAVLESVLLIAVFNTDRRRMESALARIYDRQDGDPALWNFAGATALMHGLPVPARKAFEKALQLGVRGKLAELVEANLRAAERKAPRSTDPS